VQETPNSQQMQYYYNKLKRHMCTHKWERESGRAGIGWACLGGLATEIQPSRR